MTEKQMMRRIRQLEAALLPFAAEAEEWSETVDRRYRPGLTEPRLRQAYAKAVFTMGDLRRARRLLTP